MPKVHQIANQASYVTYETVEIKEKILRGDEAKARIEEVCNGDIIYTDYKLANVVGDNEMS